MQAETHNEAIMNMGPTSPHFTEETMGYIISCPVMLGLKHDLKSAILSAFTRDLSKDKADPKFGTFPAATLCFKC